MSAKGMLRHCRYRWTFWVVFRTPSESNGLPQPVLRRYQTGAGRQSIRYPARSEPLRPRIFPNHTLSLCLVVINIEIERTIVVMLLRGAGEGWLSNVCQVCPNGFRASSHRSQRHRRRDGPTMRHDESGLNRLLLAEARMWIGSRQVDCSAAKH